MPRRPSQLSAVGYQAVLAASVVARTFALQPLSLIARARAPLTVLASSLLLGSSTAFALVQHLWDGPPWRSPRALLGVGAHAVALLVSLVLTLFGLARVGAPLTVLAEMAELLFASVLGVGAADTRASREHARAVVLMSLGYAALLAASGARVDAEARAGAAGSFRLGLVAHFVSAALALARERTSRRLALSVGGPKRLHALSHACALVISMPAAASALLAPTFAARGPGADGLAAAAAPRAEHHVGGWAALAPEPAMLALALLVVPFYARAHAHARLPAGLHARTSAASAGFAALACELLVSRAHGRAPAAALGGGALVLLGARAHVHALSPRPELDALLGGGAVAAAPPRALARAARAARAAWSDARALVRQIWARRSTRKLLLFLVLSAGFALVEAVLGRASRSLSLVSDACHMLLDCSSLAIGLYGELASRWPSSASFTYGHARQEVMCTFANSILLLLTAVALSRQAVGRLIFGGAEVDTSQLLPVALAGLGVNVLGICLFSEHHAHIGAAPCRGCDADGGTSSNMAAVLLHVAADALGSLGVIASSLLIRSFGWTLADPICSLLISVLITLSAWPLVAQSAQVLLQRTPHMLADGRRDECLAQLSRVHGVQAVSAHAFWMLSLRHNVGTVRLLVRAGTSARDVLPKARQVLRAHGIDSATIEVEQQPTTAHCEGNGHSPPDAVRTPSNGASSRPALSAALAPCDANSNGRIEGGRATEAPLEHELKSS